MKKKYFWFLLLVFVFGAFLRFYKLGEVPSSLHRDEAFLGYNAYSILKTGKDINGQFLPLHLQSFLYSPAGYSYTTIPFIWLFGLSPFSTRCPAAFFGTLTVLVTYFLARDFFKKENSALLSALFLAISPWHINLSRTAAENVVVVFLIGVGVWFWGKWLKTGVKKWLLLMFLFLSSSLVVYQAPRAFLPLFVPFLLIFSFFKAKKLRRQQLLAWLLFLLSIVLPVGGILFSEKLSLRVRTVSLFATSETQLIIDQYLREDGVPRVPILISRFFHNKLGGYGVQFLENYFAHWDFDFLFSDKGYPDRYRVPLTGLLYYFEIPLLFLGIWFLLQKRGLGFVLLIWLALAPLGSALAFDDIPNLQRTAIVFPALSITVGAGAWLVVESLRKLKFYPVLLGLALMVISYHLLSYAHQYYIHFPLYRPWYRNDGYQALVEKVNELLPNYKKAIITNRESAPAIFFLFFGQYDPRRFQEETKNTTLVDFDRIGFGKYEFSLEECPLKGQMTEKGKFIAVGGEERVLYVNSGLCKPFEENTRELAVVRRTDNTLVFRALEYTSDSF